jgi:hypothetical protein
MAPLSQQVDLIVAGIEAGAAYDSEQATASLLYRLARAKAFEPACIATERVVAALLALPEAKGAQSALAVVSLLTEQLQTKHYHETAAIATSLAGLLRKLQSAAAAHASGTRPVIDCLPPARLLIAYSSDAGTGTYVNGAPCVNSAASVVGVARLRRLLRESGKDQDVAAAAATLWSWSSAGDDFGLLADIVIDLLPAAAAFPSTATPTQRAGELLRRGLHLIAHGNIQGAEEIAARATNTATDSPLVEEAAVALSQVARVVMLKDAGQLLRVVANRSADVLAACNLPPRSTPATTAPSLAGLFGSNPASVGPSPFDTFVLMDAIAARYFPGTTLPKPAVTYRAPADADLGVASPSAPAAAAAVPSAQPSSQPLLSHEGIGGLPMAGMPDLSSLLSGGGLSSLLSNPSVQAAMQDPGIMASAQQMMASMFGGRAPQTKQEDVD